ncbi:MAG: Fe-S cluster assembly protein SufD [Armatimonadetes bacterium]|nr:Fe-S cluster assembly protein SufD [Armatimonadota bacterium]
MADTIERPITIETVEAIGKAQQEPAWAVELRRAAWERFDRTPLPSRKEEHWRRTDLKALGFEERLLANGSLSFPASPGRLPEEVAALLESDESSVPGLAVSVDGSLHSARLHGDLARSGVIFCGLDQAVREHGALIRNKLEEAPYSPADQKFTALTRALWRGGLFLYVPGGVEVEAPLRAYTAIGRASTVLPYLVVIAGAKSKVTLLDACLSPDAAHPALASGVTELYLGPEAEVRYAQAVRWGDTVYHFHRERAALAKDAHLITCSLSLGGRVSKTTVEAVLESPGAMSDMLGIVFGKGSQHFDCHTIQHHRAPHTSSDLLFKVALDEQARSVYSGMIHIERQAQQTNAYQSNRNILLSDRAHADSIPNLEIEANDVRCTHGAAVSPLDEDQLFYLMSRGLPRPEARRLMVEGFFEPVLDRLAAEPLRDDIHRWIQDRLAGV